MNKKPAGFSLIEVMFALVITFTLILGTSQLTLNSLWSKRQSDSRFELSEIVSSKLEYLKSLPFSSPELRDGNFSDRVNRDMGKHFFMCVWQVQSLSAGMKSVVMECYPENNSQGKIRLIFYLSKELGF
jgi:Tfp pilus assembly protein PilV